MEQRSNSPGSSVPHDTPARGEKQSLAQPPRLKHMAMPLARSLQIRVSGSAKSCWGRSEWLRSDHRDRPHSKGGSLWRYASKQARGRHADKRDWSFWGCFRRVGTAMYRRISLCQDPPACQLHADAGPVAHYSGSNLAFGRMQLCILLSYEPRPSTCFCTLSETAPRCFFGLSRAWYGNGWIPFICASRRRLRKRYAGYLVAKAKVGLITTSSLSPGRVSGASIAPPLSGT